MEEEATHRAIMLADLTGAPLYVVHVSAKQAVAQLAAARDSGQNVFGETCPQYLYLSLEEQLGATGDEWGDFEGAKWVCSTPLRSREEGHQDDMWQGLRTNDLQMVSTDHCPFCMKDQKELGKGDFREIPNGIGSIEHRMDLLYQGVVTGELTLERWVELTSTTPARMFGLYGTKGVIAPGADADIVVYDPNGHTSIGVREDPPHEHGLLRLGGLRDRRPRRRRASPAARSSSTDGTFHGRAGHGQFLKRGLTQYLIWLTARPDQLGHGLRRRPADQPARVAHRRPRQAGRGARLRLRLDLRLPPALAGALRHLLARSWPRPTASSSGRWSPTRRPATGR